MNALISTVITLCLVFNIAAAIASVYFAIQSHRAYRILYGHRLQMQKRGPSNG
jgi:hypothetical protein